jgi:hypothetical protein
MKTEPENELKHERSESEPSEEEHKPKTKQPKTSTKNNSSTASTGTAASRPVGATGKTILAEKIVKAGIAAVQRDIDATAAEVREIPSTATVTVMTWTDSTDS